MRLIPIDDPSLTQFSLTTDLEGVYYIFEFNWNRATNAYDLNLLKQNGDPIACGIVMVCNIPLLLSVTEPGRPPGDLRLLRSDGSDEIPVVGELGSIAKLYYFESTDA